jgi:DNA-binding response OmpR family regulator
VLVIDDDPIVTELLCSNLDEQGYSYDKAATGEDALSQLATGNIRVALLDLRLPGIPGMDVLRKVDEICPATAVIIVSAVVDTQTVIETMRLGAIDYIIKPFSLDRVNQSIETAFQRTSLRLNKPNADRDTAKKASGLDWVAKLDNIARGVEIRLESETNHAMMVIERTAAIARGMGIPEDSIAEWIGNRCKKIDDEFNYIDVLLKKLEQNPKAQLMLGLTDFVRNDPDNNNHLN